MGEEERELIEQAFAPDGGMPPFPGLDLFDPVDRAFWYGDGSGGQPLPAGFSFDLLTGQEDQ